MKLSFVYLVLLLPFFAFTQTVDLILEVEGNSKSRFYIAARKGEIINVEVKVLAGGNLSRLMLQNTTTGIWYKEKKVNEFTTGIEADSRAVFELVLENEARKPVRLQLKLDVESKNPLEIGWKHKKDTTYAYTTHVKRERQILDAQKIQQEKFYLNSRSNAFIKGGKNRVVFPIALPQNTVEWYYVFTASRKDDAVQNTLKSFNLASEISNLVKSENDLKGAISSLSSPPGANICDLYVMFDSQAAYFRENKNFSYDIEGSRENYKSGVVRLKRKNRNKLFLGLRNPDNLFGIHIAVEIVAVVEKVLNETELLPIPVITHSRMPYIRD